MGSKYFAHYYQILILLNEALELDNYKEYSKQQSNLLTLPLAFL